MPLFSAMVILIVIMKKADLGKYALRLVCPHSSEGSCVAQYPGA